MAEQDNIQAGPSKPQDHAAIRRKIYAAVTEADDLLREMLNPGRRSAPSTAWHDDIRRVRGLLAEWRLEPR